MRIVQNGKQLPTEKNDDLQTTQHIVVARALAQHLLSTASLLCHEPCDNSLLLFSIQMAAQL